MPTGTRNSISVNSTAKPSIATVSVLNGVSCACVLFDRLDLVLTAEKLGMEDQPIGAHGDQQDGGDVAEPGHQEERPDRQAQIESQNVVSPGAAYFVEQRIGLYRHHEQQY